MKLSLAKTINKAEELSLRFAKIFLNWFNFRRIFLGEVDHNIFPSNFCAGAFCSFTVGSLTVLGAGSGGGGAVQNFNSLQLWVTILSYAE